MSRDTVSGMTDSGIITAAMQNGTMISRARVSRLGRFSFCGFPLPPLISQYPFLR